MGVGRLVSRSLFVGVGRWVSCSSCVGIGRWPEVDRYHGLLLFDIGRWCHGLCVSV